EPVDHFYDVVAFDRETQLLVNGLQEPLESQFGVEDIYDPEPLCFRRFQIRPENGSLAYTDGTGDGDKTLPLLYAVYDGRQSLFMTRAKVEEIRIGRDVEGLFLEAV